MVQTAQKAEQAMKAEVNLFEDSEIKHKLNLQVQAFQTTSKVDYTYDMLMQQSATIYGSKPVMKSAQSPSQQGPVC